jgi:hypothetical protein
VNCTTGAQGEFGRQTREISAGLAHGPDRHVLDRLAAGRTQDEVVAERGEGHSWARGKKEAAIVRVFGWW